MPETPVRYLNRPNQPSISERFLLVSRSYSHSTSSNGQSYQGPRSARTSGRPRHRSSTSLKNNKHPRWISRARRPRTALPEYHNRLPPRQRLPVDPGSRARTNASIDGTTVRLPRRSARRTVRACGTTGHHDTKTPRGHAAQSACPHAKILFAGASSQPCGQALLSHQFTLARPLPSR